MHSTQGVMTQNGQAVSAMYITWEEICYLAATQTQYESSLRVFSYTETFS